MNESSQIAIDIKLEIQNHCFVQIQTSTTFHILGGFSRGGGGFVPRGRGRGRGGRGGGRGRGRGANMGMNGESSA